MVVAEVLKFLTQSAESEILANAHERKKRKKRRQVASDPL